MYFCQKHIKCLPLTFPPQMSNLVASQIMTHTDVGSRASSIEKWLAVADICRCLNNYNGVLEITSALNRSAIYRLKKTWAKVCKQVGINSLKVLLEIKTYFLPKTFKVSLCVFRRRRSWTGCRRRCPQRGGSRISERH